MIRYRQQSFALTRTVVYALGHAQRLNVFCGTKRDSALKWHIERHLKFLSENCHIRVYTISSTVKLVQLFISRIARFQISGFLIFYPNILLYSLLWVFYAKVCKLLTCHLLLMLQITIYCCNHAQIILHFIILFVTNFIRFCRINILPLDIYWSH